MYIRLHVKYLLFLLDLMKIDFPEMPKSNFMKIRPLGAELFHADGRTDRQTHTQHDANSRFSQFFERA